MSGHLDLVDSQDVADLDTFLARARRVGSTTVRLQAGGPVLAVTVCTQPGRGLMGEGTTLGMRALALAEAPAGEVDVLVGIDAVEDRLARLRAEGGAGPRRLAIPPVPAVEQWAAVAPPRGGWEPVSSIDGATVTRVATDGIAEVAADPTDAVRDRVWRAVIPGTRLPASAALAAHALGFVAPEMTLFTQGRWQRLSSPAGHVLTR